MGINIAYVFHSLIGTGANSHVRGRVRKEKCHNFPENKKPTYYPLQVQDFLLCGREILSGPMYASGLLISEMQLALCRWELH